MGRGLPTAGRAGAALASDNTPFLLRQATPDARILVGVEGVVQAFGSHGAFAAHLAGPIDLGEGHASGADREEQLRVGVATQGVIAPQVVRGS